MRRLLYAFGLVIGSTIAASAACPDWAESGEQHTLTGEDLFERQVYPVTAGGDTDIQSCGNVELDNGGVGYVMEEPDFTFELSGMEDYDRLVLMVRSECDSVLLLNTADSDWEFDDDGAGSLDARVDLDDPSDGWLDVWVGSLDGEYCDAELSLETFR